MPCNSPNKVFYLGINPDNGKKKIAFVSRHTDYIIYDAVNKTYEKCNGTPNIIDSRRGRVVTECDLVPCGQCIGCRIDYSRQWATRLMLEKKKYSDDECFFLTLTFDDFALENYVGHGEAIDPITGEFFLSPFYPVRKKIHQDFMKRLRKKFSDSKIRYFVSGEYGDVTMRCHYHYILLGIKIPDLVVYKTNFRGDVLYNSKMIDDCWTVDIKDEYGNKSAHKLGFAVLSKVSFDTCNYVTRYVVKKRKKFDKESYKMLGLEPEFCLMSRMPGIGKEYFEDNYDYLYETDEIILPGRDGAFTVSAPRYFDTLLERYNPEMYEEVKARRRLSHDEKDDFVKRVNPLYDEEDYLSTRERILENKLIVKRKENFL